ncbi:16958_t:CDS:2 [Gigaspora margarita]|uniref:16958_t:CDS:1 n=1 Tax=Gigaspora margarita TaxID=4874 RepID=A0ABM8VW38_GIGMA|nr:16958_t:CDS:2 [Gigaspora margarita]
MRYMLSKTLFQESSEYEEKELNDGNVPGLILKGFDLKNLENPEKDPVFQQARAKAQYYAIHINYLLFKETKLHILDPFGGSGTTGHAVLQLNKETGTNRTDQKEHEPLGGGFKFTTLDKQINNQAILQMERSELIDTIIASRIDKYQQKYQGLQLLKDKNYNYLIAKNANNEGFFLEVYEKIVREAQKNNLKTPYHVYARLYLCQVDTVNFYQIPDSILLDFGFDLEKDRNANIYFQESTYNKLRQVVGEKISSFVNEAVEEKLIKVQQQEKQEFQQKLIAGYKRVAKNKKIQKEMKI